MIEGYTAHEISESGEDLFSTSQKFYKRVIQLIENKEAIYRVVPEASMLNEKYYFYTRIHIKN